MGETLQADRQTKKISATAASLRARRGSTAGDPRSAVTLWV
jgi:hypothetical protein